MKLYCFLLLIILICLVYDNKLYEGYRRRRRSGYYYRNYNSNTPLNRFLDKQFKKLIKYIKDIF